MKKILSLCMAVLMLCGLCTTAFAAEITESGNQSANTTVRYGVESSYVVTVPDIVSINTDTLMGNIDVNVTDVILPAGYQLSVTLTSDFTLTDIEHDVNTLGYEVKLNDAAIDSGDMILTVDSGDTDGGSVRLSVSVTETPTTAGAYSDVMTFGVSVSTNIPAQQTVSGIWVFNDNPYHASTIINENVNFTSNRESYTEIYTDGMVITYDDNTMWDIQDGGWYDTAYKTIDFGSTEQAVSDEFYTWLTADATQQVTHTVSGVWVFNDTIPSTSPIKQSVNFVSNNQSFTVIDYRAPDTYESNVYYDTLLVYEADMVEWHTQDLAYQNIDFGTTPQEVSSEFYTWLTANATKQTASLISFTINGTSYQAEEGMTWGEWVESDYNTGAWVASGDYITDGGMVKILKDGSFVRTTTLIIANAAYSVMQSGGSDN